MPTAPTHQFPLLNACLQQHAVQVLGRLAGHQLRLGRGTGRGLRALDEVGGCGGGRGEVGEAELLFMLVNMHLLDHVVLWESCRRAWNSSPEWRRRMWGGPNHHHDIPLCRLCGVPPTSDGAKCCAGTAGSCLSRGSRAPSPSGARGSWQPGSCTSVLSLGWGCDALVGYLGGR